MPSTLVCMHTIFVNVSDNVKAGFCLDDNFIANGQFFELRKIGGVDYGSIEADFSVDFSRGIFGEASRGLPNDRFDLIRFWGRDSRHPGRISRPAAHADAGWQRPRDGVSEKKNARGPGLATSLPSSVASNPESISVAAPGNASFPAPNRNKSPEQSTSRKSSRVPALFGASIYRRTNPWALARTRFDQIKYN